MNVVDSHFHINISGFSLTKIIKYLDSEGLDCCWLLSWEEIKPGPWDYQYLPVEDIYKAHLKYPSRIIPFYAPDPHRSDAITQLQKWYQRGIRGCGELKATLNWNSEQIREILKTVEKLKIPILFHMENSQHRNIPYSDKLYDILLFGLFGTNKKIFSFPQRVLQNLVNQKPKLKKRFSSSYFFPGYMLDFASLEATLQDYPDIKFIAHGPMFWENISDSEIIYDDILPTGPITKKGIIWRLLQDYPNLFADISGLSAYNALVRDSENAKKFLTLFEDKILYGTDNLMRKQRYFLNSLCLSKITYKKIYGENAFRII